jgi:pimeloyl-ACP methyl ester carboxylesterase
MKHSYGAVTRCVLVSVAALALAFTPSALRYCVALLVLAKLSSLPLPAAVERGLLHEVVETPLALHTLRAEVRARRYVPRGVHNAPKLLLLHGVHALGVDEPRLQGLARALASAGIDVLTPELPQLTQYRVVPELVADIGDVAARWTEQTGARSLGVVGISFAGGLALQAAAAQSGKRPIGFVVTVGAHHDLLRVCDYYAGRDVRGPAGERTSVPPHPYGPRVILRSMLPRLVSEADLPLLTQALDTYLHDKPNAARKLAQGLSPEGREIAGVLLDDHGSETLSRWLIETAERERSQLSAASPSGQLGRLQVPVLLLHGAADPIVPSIETRYLARELPAEQLRDVLISDLLRHAELSELPSPSQVYRFARFIQRLVALAKAQVR